MSSPMIKLQYISETLLSMQGVPPERTPELSLRHALIFGTFLVHTLLESHCCPKLSCLVDHQNYRAYSFIFARSLVEFKR